MKRRGWMVPAAAVLSVVTLGGGAFAATAAHAGSVWGRAVHRTDTGMTGSGGGMMGGGSSGSGGGMMGGGGMMADHAALDSRTQLNQQVRQGERGAVIDRQTNTVTYSGQTVTLVALASPHGKPNMTWEIDGLVNPTLVMPAGAHVQVLLANMDWGYMHGFEVTATPPPYAYMSMMSVNSDFLLMPLPERTTKSLSTARYYTRTGELHLSPGTYHYLCPMPGHAQQGMYGTLKIG